MTSNVLVALGYYFQEKYAIKSQNPMAYPIYKYQQGDWHLVVAPSEMLQVVEMIDTTRKADVANGM